MREQFEADQLHNKQQPAKPMTGDRPGDHDCLGKSTCGGCDPNCPANTDKPKPVTPPAAVPEQGEFERVVRHGNTLMENINNSQPRISRLYSRLIFAHNSDMSEARKRIAELEKDKCSGPDCGKPSKMIATLEAENAQLRADKAEMVNWIAQAMERIIEKHKEDA